MIFCLKMGFLSYFGEDTCTDAVDKNPLEICQTRPKLPQMMKIRQQTISVKLQKSFDNFKST